MAFALRRTIQAMRLLIETASKEARRRGFKVPVVTSLGISEDAALLQQVAKAQHETVLVLV